MTALTIDTLEVSRELQEAGLDIRQAEGVSQAIRKAQEQNLGELATKADIKAEVTRLEGEIRLNRWMLGILLAGVASLILKTFFGG